MQLVSADFARRIVELHGPAGADWLTRLPDIIADCERRWSLTVMPPFDPLSYNYVAPAIGPDGTATVLKAGVPHRELTAEMEALELYGGHGSVQLLQADPEQGVMLLERLLPGCSLSSLADDEQATSQAAHVMRELWRPAPLGHTFATTRDWSAGLTRLRNHFGGTTGPFPTALVEAAERLFSELHTDSTEQVVLHGDLHHDNILSGTREAWLAIDPKGVVGEPTYETGAFLRNHFAMQVAAATVSHYARGPVC